MIKIGDIIDNRYNVLSHLGTGGMAVVFECKDLFLDRVVAVKILKEELLTNKSAIEDFKKEVKASVSMAHTNIIQIYQDGMFENRPYLVMEFLDQQTLLDKLEYFTKFSVKESLEIMYQLLDAVSYTHEHKIIHRDIKPQNIFYLPNGTIKLADFGIASNEKDAGIDGKIIGSVHYLAPEVLIGKPYTIEADIYALGVTFFQLLTGHLPFEGTTKEISDSHLRKSFPKVSNFNAQISPLIDDVILKAVEKNPKKRFRSAKEFKISLENAASGKVKKQSIFRRIFG